MQQQTPSAYVIVGVVPGHPPAVVTAAAVFAERFDAELVCASVDPTHYTVVREPDGAIVAMPLDPDLADDIVEAFDPGLHNTIAAALEGHPIRWSVRALAGGPAQELAQLAGELDAAMIVVGTREAGIRGSLHEFFNGSVAVQLAHRQHRPVVVVPLNPVGAEGQLPWTDEG
ncbi:MULTISPECIES: universal stress protein [unclassified Microbacterium]|uniref:universal stress protein n=1 Tax=unclassified Microbacterium TaxID=2609290 RepID=UPI0030170554